jgi:hypothetical protein
MACSCSSWSEAGFTAYLRAKPEEMCVSEEPETELASRTVSLTSSRRRAGRNDVVAVIGVASHCEVPWRFAYSCVPVTIRS